VYTIYEPGVSSEVIVYTDGVKEGSLSLFGDPIGTCDYPVTLGLNGNRLVNSQWHHNYYGHIDDVRIYNRALEDCEIACMVQEARCDPLAHYPFDDGTADDVSGNEHHGTLENLATIVYDADRDSNVLDVGDANGYVDCGGGHDLNEPNCTEEPANCTWADITGELTLMAWVKPDIIEQGQYRAVVISKGDDGGYHRNFPADPNRNREGWSMVRRDWYNEVTISMVGSANTASFFTPLEGIPQEYIDVNIWDSKWHHIAAVYDNINWIDLYVDGLHAAHWWAKSWNDPQTIGTTNYPIWIGANVGEVLGAGAYADGYHAWKGLIDDVRIYERALIQVEVAAAMAGMDPCLCLPERFPGDLYFEGWHGTVNFKDYRILANEWLEEETFPFKE